MTSSFERGLNGKKKKSAPELSEYIEEPEKHDSGLCLSALVFPSCVLRQGDFLLVRTHNTLNLCSDIPSSAVLSPD